MTSTEGLVYHNIGAAVFNRHAWDKCATEKGLTAAAATTIAR